MIPLSMVSSGELVEVVTVKAGWGLQRRLGELGLTTGAQVRVITGHRRGSVLIDIRGSRLALGRGVAHRIMVKSL